MNINKYVNVWRYVYTYGNTKKIYNVFFSLINLTRTSIAHAAITDVAKAFNINALKIVVAWKFFIRGIITKYIDKKKRTNHYLSVCTISSWWNNQVVS